MKLEGEEDLSKLAILYERLPTFYFQCGKIGHVFKECSEYKPITGVTDFKHLKYGPWMRTTSYVNKFRWNRVQEKEGRKIVVHNKFHHLGEQ